MNTNASRLCASDAAELIRFPDLYAQGMEEIERSARGGLLIGRMHSSPYFLNFEGLMNPHAFICGITGSGKTYLMKSLVLRLCIVLGATAVLIDFTGEYKGFVDILGEYETAPEDAASLLGSKNSGIVYVNLKESGKEQLKVELADGVLGGVLEGMRRSARNRRVFVIIDEAWKLLSQSRALQTILREGRKYGYGLIFSSQLVEDIDLSMLSNAATLFIFRIQNKRGLGKLADNYNLDEKQVETIQNLEVGSCVAVQTSSDKRRGFFLIKKVVGVEAERFMKILLGGKMEVEITRQKFETVIGDVCGKEALAKTLRIAEEKGRIELAELTLILLSCGAKKGDVLNALRKLGIRDKEIADSFAVATLSRNVHETSR